MASLGGGGGGGEWAQQVEMLLDQIKVAGNVSPRA